MTLDEKLVRALRRADAVADATAEKWEEAVIYQLKSLIKETCMRVIGEDHHCKDPICQIENKLRSDQRQRLEEKLK